MFKCRQCVIIKNYMQAIERAICKYSYVHDYMSVQNYILEVKIC